MFFTHKSPSVKILVALTMIIGTFNPIPARSSTNKIMQSAATTRFAVIGDFGFSSQNELDVANLVKNWDPDLVITTGDNNYPNGGESTIDENIGRYYHEFIHPYTGSYGTDATANRFFPTMGNHDWDSPNAQPYLDYFTLPGNERYYDFVWGPVHFFMLDSDIHEPDGITSASVQAAWLQTQLAASTSKWKLVVLHHAPYSSSTNHGSNPDLQWPFAAWGADAVLAGHDHSYERLAIDGIQYIVNGSGGHPNLYPFGTPLSGSRLRYYGNNGAMLVEATATELTFSFMTRTGQLIDKKVLTKNSIDASKLQLQPVISGLSQPVFITHAGDNSDRLFILERAGRIRIVKNGTLLSTPFLNMQSIVNSTGSEQGLFALAFHPQFESNGYFYTVHTNSSGSLVLSRFTASPANTDQASFNSRIELILIPHPTYANHNGGTLAFDSNGYLYWSTGDGGGTGDPFNNAQNLNSLLGKILRLDVDSASPYAIPSTNPFYNNTNAAVLREIWAYGLRNPWRFSFDSLTRDIYIGDVGQSSIEEINFQAANSAGGENYGWRVMEGNQCYNPSSGCNQSGKVLPVTQYNHTLGCSVTGGYVYRGSNYPSLYGHYFYGDYCSGRLFSIYKNAQSGWQPSVELKDTSLDISTFGEDEQKELYLADYATGTLYNIRYQDPVTLSGNVGASGVTLSYTDGLAKTVISSANGSYSFSIPYDWSGTVIPSHICFTFMPSSNNYSNVTSNQTAQDYASIPKPGCADIDVNVSGTLRGSYGIPSGETTFDRYRINGGPVHVTSTDGETPIFTSERAIFGASFNSIVGYPGDQLTTDYWFTSYDDVGMITFLVIGNPHPTDIALVDVYIGGVKRNTTPYSIGPGQRIFPRYGINAGPVHVVSTNGVDIFTSERTRFGNSFNEVMGYPGNQLATDYWFTSYDDKGMITFLVIGNPHPTDTALVDVYIGGVKRNTTPYQIAPGQRIFPRFGINAGPVHVVSTNGVEVFSSERTRFGNTFNEVMGYPGDQVSTEFWFTSYDDTSMITFLVVGNPHPTDTAEVDVYIGGVKKNLIPYVIAPGQRVFPRFGINAGPVHVVSTNGVEVFASERSKYLNSFNEILGLAAEQLATDYWFTSYDDVGMTTFLIVGTP